MFIEVFPHRDQRHPHPPLDGPLQEVLDDGLFAKNQPVEPVQKRLDGRAVGAVDHGAEGEIGKRPESRMPRYEPAVDGGMPRKVAVQLAKTRGGVPAGQADPRRTNVRSLRRAAACGRPTRLTDLQVVLGPLHQTSRVLGPAAVHPSLLHDVPGEVVKP